jgi:hypothetical protein
MTQTYTHLHMEAATCLWEAMLENRNRPASQLWGSMEGMRVFWDNFGTAAVRQTAIDLADDVLKVWNSMSQDEQDSCVPYDWEFVPAFLALVEFHDTGHYPITDHRAMADRILAPL